MSDSDKPAWPPSAFPFMPFSMPGTPAGPAAQTATASGLAGGIDAMKSFWGSLPGRSQVPGFLVPTLDVDELDRRITDLRAAESWVEVNLNLLRGTIQGLEVQRHTIAALQSMTAPGSAPPLAGGAAFDWTQALVPDRKTQPATPKAPEAAAWAAEPTPSAPAAAALPELATTSWLGYLQDQFAKVAEAALAGAKTVGGSVPGKPATADATRKGAATANVATKAGKVAAKRRRTSGSGSRKPKTPD